MKHPFDPVRFQAFCTATPGFSRRQKCNPFCLKGLCTFSGVCFDQQGCADPGTASPNTQNTITKDTKSMSDDTSPVLTIPDTSATATASETSTAPPAPILNPSWLVYVENHAPKRKKSEDDVTYWTRCEFEAKAEDQTSSAKRVFVALSMAAAKDKLTTKVEVAEWKAKVVSSMGWGDDQLLRQYLATAKLVAKASVIGINTPTDIFYATKDKPTRDKDGNETFIPVTTPVPMSKMLSHLRKLLPEEKKANKGRGAMSAAERLARQAARVLSDDTTRAAYIVALQEMGYSVTEAVVVQAPKTDRKSKRAAL